MSKQEIASGDALAITIQSNKERKMSAIKVRILKLDYMRVASFYGFGREPETIAWEKLTAFAKPKDYLDDPENHRIFGFNNPDPSAGSPNYGYEVCIEVGPEVEPEGEMRVKSFDGGWYAVTRCEVRGGNYQVIGDLWKKLVAWREDSPYDCGYHQWLEMNIPEPGLEEGEFTMDLYLPISK
jgi:DNA gyrase inhibitor GyrI